MRLSIVSALSLVTLIGLTAQPVAGGVQQQDSVVADSVKVVPLYRLEGVTVSVTRSRDLINRLPYAVGILGAAEIQGLEATISLDEALLEIPGVFVNNRYNFGLGDRISIRGFGSRSQFGVRGIRIIQDGIPLTLPDGQAQLNNVDLAAAGRIEVIRGPASSLYGNAAGGVISIETEPPPPVPFRPEIRIQGGGFGDDRFHQKYDLKAAGQSGDFDYVGHVSHFQTDGFRLHSRAEYTLLNTRVRYRIDERSNLTAVINYVNSPVAQNSSSLRDSLARANPDTARDLVLSPQECPPSPGFGGCQDLGEASKQGQAGITYRRQFGTSHEVSLMGYGVFRNLDNPIPFTLIQLDRLAGGTRAEYRYTPAEGRLAGLTLGFDVDHQSDDRQEFRRTDTGVQEIELDQDEKVTGLGVFAHSRWVLTPELGLTVSARYDRIRFKVDDDLVTADDPDDSGSRTFDQLNPMVGLSYASAPWLNVYGNVGRSFQTPSTTEFTDTIGGFNFDLKPERATSYEVGAKGTAADRVSYSLALFRSNIDNQLIGFEAANDRVLFRNVGSSQHKGVEAGIAALLAPGLTLTGAYTFSDFEFEDFVTDGGDFSGNEIPGIPRHYVHGRVKYAHWSGLKGAVELTAADGYFADNANEHRNDGYTTIDLRFGYTADLPGARIEPFLGINNVTDKRYNSSVVVNAFGRRFFEPAPGRNVYAGLRLQTR